MFDERYATTVRALRGPGRQARGPWDKRKGDKVTHLGSYQDLFASDSRQNNVGLLFSRPKAVASSGKWAHDHPGSPTSRHCCRGPAPTAALTWGHR
jgi:hypothetical protein